MKKVIILFLLVCGLCSMLSGCTNNTEAKPTVIGDAAPTQYESEEAFVSAVKNGRDSNGWDIKDITYYYRPKTLPEGAILKYVQVRDTYVMFVYTLDTDKKSTDYTKNILLCWYRYFSDTQAYIADSTSRLKFKIVSLPEQAEGMTISAIKSFSEGKKEYASGELSDPTWSVQWVQEGACFGGSIPWTIPEADIAKYLEMEKVIVE